VSKSSYDREDYSYDVKDSIASSSKSTAVAGDYSFDDLDFDKFSAFMSKKFGEERFKKGYEIMQKYKSDRFEKNSEIDTALKGVLSKESDVEQFVGLCSSYMLLDNYASSMGGK
jgi:hypothetical protein